MSEINNAESTRLHNFDLASFKKAQDDMIATSDLSWTSRYNQHYRDRVRDYTVEEVNHIIENGSLQEQQRLSRNYFAKNGFYKQIIMHYATLLKYSGILIANPSANKSLSTSHVQKRYLAAVDFIDKMNLPSLLAEWASTALINGGYYGLLVKSKSKFNVLDLPNAYCISRFKDFDGNDVIEFNVSYFNSIVEKADRNTALALYPEIVQKTYRKWNSGRLGNPWVVIPSDVGICFPMFDGRPFFLSTIPSIIQYGEAVETEQERNKEEIRKIIVQKVPHLQDGRLLFEPEEAVEMHSGTVGMVRNNKNTSVLTTYADVDAIVSKSSVDGANSSLESMKQNIYSQAGITSEIFASSGGNTTDASLNFDMSVMMVLAHKFAKFVTNVVNSKFANSNIDFKYIIFPVTHYNQQKFIDGAYKLATTGYSFLLPAVAQGFTQRDLVNLKELENDVLKLSEKLIPLQTSFTQGAGTNDSKHGRPEKDISEKSDKTLQNENSIEDSNVQGGSK